ncbi:hypothetical protein CPC08DRAFT_769141 [Agrocybe pediades]|nr:hypothetical protein CPC08DRAFT_769141 [Agrocybe pediades]
MPYFFPPFICLSGTADDGTKEPPTNSRWWVTQKVPGAIRFPLYPYNGASNLVNVIEMGRSYSQAVKRRIQVEEVAFMVCNPSKCEGAQADPSSIFDQSSRLGPPAMGIRSRLPQGRDQVPAWGQLRRGNGTTRQERTYTSHQASPSILLDQSVAVCYCKLANATHPVHRQPPRLLVPASTWTNSATAVASRTRLF